MSIGKKVGPLKSSRNVTCITDKPFVSREKIIHSSLHIKLGSMKQYAKTLNTDGDCFPYNCKTLSDFSKEKLKLGIFEGFQILQLKKEA